MEREKNEDKEEKEMNVEGSVYVLLKK